MLRNKLHWLKASDKLAHEIRQCTDEGRVIDSITDSARVIMALPDSEEKEAAAALLLRQMESCPIRPDFPYHEPESYEDILKVLPPDEEQASCFSDEELREKLGGAWTGRACGCLLGIPVEGWPRQKIADFLNESGQAPLNGYLKSDVSEEVRNRFDITDVDPHKPYDRQFKCWINNMSELPVDDDMNYTVLSLRVLETCGKLFTAEDVAEAWLYAIPAMHTCTAERVAYRNLLLCTLPPESGIYENPYREWIGAQIRVDFYGYINPGNPREAARMAYQDAVVAQSKNGVYAAMYIAALISLMPTAIDYRAAVLKALKQIPPASRLTAEIERVVRQYDDGLSLVHMLNDLHTRYNEKDPFDWCLAIPNVLVIIDVLLHCGNDYSRAICEATAAGFDTDCNAATVGSIIGFRIGLKGIDTKWTSPIRQIFHSSVYHYESVPVPELVERTLNIIRQ